MCIVKDSEFMQRSVFSEMEGKNIVLLVTGENVHQCTLRCATNATDFFCTCLNLYKGFCPPRIGNKLPYAKYKK